MYFAKASLLGLCLASCAIQGHAATTYPPGAAICMPDGIIPSLPSNTVVLTGPAGVTIPKDGKVTVEFEVTVDVKICDLDLYVDIFHDWKKILVGGIENLEVDLELRAPSQVTVETRVLDNDCGIFGDETVKELFSDEGTANLEVTAPFFGVLACPDGGAPVKPAGQLSVFDGKSTKGTWVLEAEDNRDAYIVNHKNGKINCWTLLVTPCPEEPDDKDGVGMGDPHFQTWSGDWYDFHGVCDLVFLKNPSFRDGTGMWVHIRTQERYGYSFIEGAAIKIGDDVLEVGAYGSYMLNGVSKAEMPGQLDQYKVEYQQINDKVFRFDIDLGAGKRIVIKSVKDLVSVSIENASLDDFGESQGLLGLFHNGKRIARNGTYVADVNEFGMEWQVLDTEETLFQVNRAPQYPMQCTIPTAATTEGRRRLGESIAREAAEKACEHWEDMKEQCVFDIMAAGDLDLAAWAL